MSEISYTLCKVDLIEFNEHHAKINTRYGKSVTRHRVVWPGVFIVLAVVVAFGSNDAEFGLYILAGAVAWSLGVPAYIKKKFHKRIAENMTQEAVNEALGDYTLKVTKQGVLETAESGEKLIKWKKVLKVEQAKRYLFIYLGETDVVIIPKKTITEKGAFKIFYKDLIDALTAYGTKA